MRKIILLAAVALSFTACVTTVGLVIPTGAVPLGERTVNWRADHDAIGVGAYEGTFRSLYFVVEKNSIELFNVTVVYGNGERERFDTRLVFNEGSRSRVLDFHGGKRIIRSIQFTYRTVGTWENGRARVVVYGVR